MARLIVLVLILGTACRSPDAVPGSSAQRPIELGVTLPEARNPQDCLETFDPAADVFLDRVTPRFAAGFTVRYTSHTKEVTVELPGGAEPLRWVLVQCGTPMPEVAIRVEVIEIPVRTVVTTSTTELPHLVSLGVADRLVGHDELDYVSSPAVRERIARGEIVEVGASARLNLEIVLDLDPDLVLAASFGDAERGLWDQLRQGGVVVAPELSFLETSPLGQAEWILFTSLFFNREAAATAIFDEVAARYAELAEHGRRAAGRPTVLVGGPTGDVWYVPGGKSFMARLVADAGGTYLWAGEPSAGSVPLAVEAAYERAAGADVWLHPGAWTSAGQIARADERFTALASFRAGRVYANDARTNAVGPPGAEQGLGGNDYWETGTARPDLVLADLLAILHPELVPEHELVFHRRLELDD